MTLAIPHYEFKNEEHYAPHPLYTYIGSFDTIFSVTLLTLFINPPRFMQIFIQFAIHQQPDILPFAVVFQILPPHTPIPANLIVCTFWQLQVGVIQSVCSKCVRNLILFHDVLLHILLLSATSVIFVIITISVVFPFF